MTLEALLWRFPVLRWLVPSPLPIDPVVPDPIDDMSDRSSDAPSVVVGPPANAASDPLVSSPVSDPFEPPVDVHAANAEIPPPEVPVLPDWAEAAAGVLWLFVSPCILMLSVFDVPFVETRSVATTSPFCGVCKADKGCSTDETFK